MIVKFYKLKLYTCCAEVLKLENFKHIQAMVVTVAEEGNRRKGGMSIAEARQCVNDTITWFKRIDDFDCIEGSEEDLEPLAKATTMEVPTTLVCLLEACKGSIWFAEKMGLSADGIVDALGKVSFRLTERPAFCVYFLTPRCARRSSTLATNSCRSLPTRTKNTFWSLTIKLEKFASSRARMGR